MANDNTTPPMSDSVNYLTPSEDCAKPGRLLHELVLFVLPIPMQTLRPTSCFRALCVAASLCAISRLFAQLAPAAGEEHEDPLILSAFEVSSERDTEYRATNAVSSNRFNTSLKDTPQSVTVLTEAFLTDLEVIDLNEALVYVPGIVPDSFGPAGNDDVQIRGQPAPERLLDSMPDLTPNFRPDPAMLERVEIIKGSSSSLYGSSWPGGVINQITKKPKAKREHSINLQFGSYNLLREVVDFTGPVNQSKTLLYRFIAVYEQGDSFRDYVNNDRWGVMPTFTYIFRPGTQLTLSYDHLETRTTADSGMPILPGEITVTLPRERFLSLPDQDFDITRNAARVSFSHRINARWSLRAGYTYTDIDSIQALGQVYGNVNANNHRQNRRLQTRFAYTKAHVAQIDALGQFKTGPFSHRMLVGIDYRHTDQDLTLMRQEITPNYVNVDTPTYDYSPNGSPFLELRNTSLTDSLGFYFQDQTSLLNDKLQFVLGLRYDQLKQVSTSINAPDPLTFRPPDVLSPRYAVLYRPIPATTFYATYGESYRPDTSGRPMFGTDDRIEPTTGVLYETGAKTLFFKDRLSLDLEVFELTRENIVDADPNHSGYVIQSGKERSRGYAVSFNVDPLPGLTLFGGYGHTKGNIIEGNRPTDPNVGKALRGLPEDSFTVFVKYRFRNGHLKGLGLGAGYRWVEEFPGAYNRPFVNPSYQVVDAQVNYGWRVGKTRWSANLAVKNLLDEYYLVNPVAQNGDNRIGVPRSYRFSLKLMF